MRNFFSPDSIAMRTLSTFCDLLLLNLLFLLCCIPLFTIGASFTAMYRVTFKLLRHEEPMIARSFFQAFRESFKQSTFFWLPSLLLYIFFIADLYIIWNVLTPSYRFLQYPILVVLLLMTSVLIFVFPQIAVFENSNKILLKNAALLSLGNFPTTLFVIIVHALLAGIATLSGKMLIIVLSCMFFFGFSTLAYIFTIFYRRIFNKCINDEDNAL